jgi:hypothetical protein
MIGTATGSLANGTYHHYGINSADTAMKAHFKNRSRGEEALASAAITIGLPANLG